MRNKLKRLKIKRNISTIMLALLFVFVFILFGILKTSIKTIKVNNILTKTSSLNASIIDGISEGVQSNNYDEIKYQIKIDKDKNDTASIIGTLTSKENKYARFKEIKNGVVSDNGKKIEINTNKSRVTITVIVENAPYGTKIEPKFTINSTDNPNIEIEPVTITGKSVQGIIKDEDGTLYNGIELSLSKDNEEVKRTYSKNDGEYVFSLGDLESYELKLAEDKYRIVRLEEETADENQRILNIVIEEVEPFNLSIQKSISKLDLVINGKTETYNYNDESKVVRAVKNAKTIEGSIHYNITIKNEGEMKGTVSVLKDILPDGLSFDPKKNPGWTKEGKNLFYTVVEDKELNPFEKVSAKLILDIEKTEEAKNYINSAYAAGDRYNYVAYYLNNSIYKEEYVSSLEKIEEINPNIENFGGWFTDRNYTNKYNFNNVVSKDIVLFGQIINNKYNVTYIDINPNNDEETILDIVEVPEGNSVDLVNAPEYKGYTFKCFTLNDNCYDDEEIIEDTILYTKYKINNYSITYNLNNGSLSEENPESYTVNDVITLNNPTKEGYTFIGWTGTGLNEETLNVEISDEIGNREYTANYEINKSSLTINPNGGTYLDNSSSVIYEENYGTIKQIENSVRRGYTFTGYEKTGGGIYSNNTYTFDNDNGVLDATYEINTYNITYNNITNSERNTLNNPTTYDVETNTFTLKIPSTRKDGNGNNSEDFLGWDDGSGNVSINITIEKGSIGDRTYSAVWKTNEDDYGITYSLNNGVLDNSNPSTYKRTTNTFTLNNPTKEGYAFAGWTGTGLSGLTKTVTISKGSSGNRNYEANYELIPYSISYTNLTSEEISNLNNISTYNIETNTFTLSNPTRRGYIFTGWTGTGLSSKSLSVIVPKGSIGNREYKANFDKADYSITYTLNNGVLGDGVTNPIKYSVESENITLNNPTKEGYIFIGWSGTGLNGIVSNVTIPTGSIGHRSYLANYTPITYNITYDYVGGILDEGVTNPSSYNIESENLILNNPTKEGYIFKNYTIDNVIATTIPTGSIGDKHLVANYEIRKYHVNYYNDNVLFQSDTVDWNTSETRPSSNATKAHHIFLYWSSDGVNEFDFNTLIRDDINLYAVYEEVVSPSIEISPSLNVETNKTWVCGDSNNEDCGVTISLTSEHSDYDLYYKIGDGEAVLYTNPIKVYTNSTIYAWSSKSNINSELSNESIVNVDTTAPTINNPGTGAMSFNMTVSGTAQDADSGVKKFTMYVKEKTALDFDDSFTYVTSDFEGIKDHAENYDHTFYGVTDNTEYIVRIVAEDYVGNTSEREVEVKTHPYVARVIGKNNMLWYTVDPITNEKVVDEGKEFLLFDSIQSAINYCDNIQCTIETNPIYDVTNESFTVGEDQNITIDLDGREIISDQSVTIVNNGTLHIVDRNEEIDGSGNYTKIGTVKNNVSKAIINNGTLVIGDGSNEPGVTFEFPILDKPIIEGKEAAIEQNDTLYYFDGKIVSDTLAIINNGDDAITQYSYNVTMTTEDNKMVATLSIVNDPEARIKSTYYTKFKATGVDNAFNSSKSGTTNIEEKKVLSTIRQIGDYGFIYNAIDDSISVGNGTEGNIRSISYVKLDLTNYTEGQFITFDVSSYANYDGSKNNMGYVYLSETLDITGNNLGTELIRLTGLDETRTIITYLEEGKTYYLYFVFNKVSSAYSQFIDFKVSNFNVLGEFENINGINLQSIEKSYYPFIVNDDNSIEAGYKHITNTNYYSYIMYDLRNIEEDINLLLDVELNGDSSDRGRIYVLDHPEFRGGTNPSISSTELSLQPISRTYTLTLTAGQINYVNFSFYKNMNSNEETDGFKIKSLAFTNCEKEDMVLSSGLNTNVDDETSFETLSVWNNQVNNEYKGYMFNTSLNEDQTGINFNGTNSYVRIPNINNVSWSNFTWDVTFSINTIKNSTIMSNFWYGGMRIYIDSNKLKATVRDNGDKTFILSENLETNREYKVTISMEDTGLSVYLDNELKGTGPNQYGGTQNSTIIALGANPIGFVPQDNTYFDGTIYDAKIYNRGLSLEEIENGTTSGLLLHLDGSNPNITNDAYANILPTNATYAHSYLTYDLTNSTEDKYLYINVDADMYMTNSSFFIKKTDNTDMPNSVNSSLFYQKTSIYRADFIQENLNTIIRLEKGKINYVHFVYNSNNANTKLVGQVLLKEFKLYNNYEEAYLVNRDNYETSNYAYFENPIINSEVDTIELLKNITLDTSLVIPEEKEVVIDLNGYTLTTNKQENVIKNKGKLTIIDSEYEELKQRNIDYKIYQATLYEEAISNYLTDLAAYEELQKTSLEEAANDYLTDLAAYEEYAGLCEGCEPSAEYLLAKSTEIEYDYTGEQEEYIAPYTGTYKIEVWGAQGGGYIGGNGSYSSGEISLEKGQVLYINVGGQGENFTGGYNGGGFGGEGSGQYGYGGGGATHVAFSSGELKQLSSNLSSVIIVAGGGGGDGGSGGENPDSPGGSGGGYIANSGYDGYNRSYSGYNGTGATSSSAGYAVKCGSSGAFGVGADFCNSGYGGAGGGGGYFGGGGSNRGHGGAGGGSGYIGNSLLTNGEMYCYNCAESDEESTKTISTTCASEDPTSNCSKTGNGYVKISVTDIDQTPQLEDYIKGINISSLDIENLDINEDIIAKIEEYDSEELAKIEYDFTGKQENYIVPYAGTYKIEVWGAQGGNAVINNSVYTPNVGYGGYSSGLIYLEKGQNLYINVGQQGQNGVVAGVAAGGYNGGGIGTWDNSDDEASGGGGGATSIGLKTGLLTSYENDLDNLLIVAGGGGGSSYTYSAGAGGGYRGGYTSSTNQNVVDQTEGYLFGKGQDASGTADSDGVAGGGGGLYGGYMNNVKKNSSGSGGSGYIGNSLLTNGVMYCYNCLESNEESIKTISTTCASEEPTSNCSKIGNGYVRISNNKPQFKDYIGGIDISSSIDIDNLNIEDEVIYNNEVEEIVVGSIVSTIENTILNEDNAELVISSGNININANNKSAIENRGKLSVGTGANINANGNYSNGIYNETNGEIDIFKGIIYANGSNSIGLLNKSNDANISGIKAITKYNNTYGIYNRANTNIIYSDLDISGAGIGLYEISVYDIEILDSSIKSTSSYSLRTEFDVSPTNLIINNSNLYGTLLAYRSAKIISIENSTLNYIENSGSEYIYINSSLIENRNGAAINNRNGQSFIENSILTGTSIVVNNYGNLNLYKVNINNSEINVIGNNNAISNEGIVNLHNTNIYNKGTASPTAISNSGNINITGKSYIDKGFAIGIDNSGTLTLGSNNDTSLEEFNYVYTGKQEVFEAPEDGYYKLETWGASGSTNDAHAGGGYASGIVELHRGDKLYIHVGGHSQVESNNIYECYGTYNGGGAFLSNYGRAGGGSTDISLSSEDNEWIYENGCKYSRRSDNSYSQRILVAGGGGSSSSGYGGNTSAGYALGYADRYSGGGYYGGTNGSGGSSYASDILSDVVFKSGLEEMPNYYTGSIKGNFGIGHAKITLLSGEGDKVESYPVIQGRDNGLVGQGKVYYYDGVIESNKALSTKINDVPSGYDIYKTSGDIYNEKVILLDNNNSKPVTSGEEFVAKIGNAKYTTIQNAVDAANNGDEIDLLVDIYQQNTINIESDKEVTIDYNDHILVPYSATYLFNNAGILTIKDSVNSKRENGYYSNKYFYNTGTLNINNIYFKDLDYSEGFIENNDGIVNINDAKIMLGGWRWLNRNQGIYNSSNGTINITNTQGGTSTTCKFLLNYGTANITNISGYFQDNGIFNYEDAELILDNHHATNYVTSRSVLNYGNAIIQNTNMNGNENFLVENTGVLTLKNNNLLNTNPFITSASGVTIVESGTYSLPFSVRGTGRTIDNTDNLYSFIMKNGTLSNTLNLSTTGIVSIENGSIIVNGDYAINNTDQAIINLGIKDGIVDARANTKPVITGNKYGIYTTNSNAEVNFYDGIISGENAYNISIGELENNYSIHTDIDNNIETKYLTNEPILRNVTQDITYSSINELNTAIESGLIGSDTIEAVRNITITKYMDPIVVPEGASIRFNLNGYKIDKNNEKLFVNNGTLTIIDNSLDSNTSTGTIDSTNGVIFENNGILYIEDGNFISERSNNSSSIIKNNNGGQLFIDAGTYTKYYDKLGLSTSNNGEIINNSGYAEVKNSTFYTNGSFVEESYYWNYAILASAAIVNNANASISVQNCTFDGITSNTLRTLDEYRNYSYQNKGELIHNYGLANFVGITSDVSHIGMNQGRLSINNSTITGICSIDSFNYPNLFNYGSLSIVDSSVEADTSFIENYGSLLVDNSTIDKLTNGSTYRDTDGNAYQKKTSHVIRNYSDSNVDIIDSEIYNRGSGEVIDNYSIMNIESSKIEASNNNAINNRGTLNVIDESEINSITGIGINLLNNSVLNLGEPIENDHTVSITYPIIKGKTYGIYNNNSTVNFYDGILMGQTNSNYGLINNIEVGYSITSGTNNNYKTAYLDRVPIIKNISKSPNVEYYDLKEAFDNASSGDTLQMISNYKNLLTDQTATINNNVTLDLNGYTIEQSNDILFVNNSTFNIIDTSINKIGSIKAFNGTKTFENNGTMVINNGIITTDLNILLFQNNTGATLNIDGNVTISSTIQNTLIDNSGILNIYNGAYIHYVVSNGNANLIINRNIMNIIDLNNNDDNNSSSTLDAPRIYAEGSIHSKPETAAILTDTGATTTIYGGIYNNGETYDNGTPDTSMILYNKGTTTIKNIESYTYLLGYNYGTLNIGNSYFSNGTRSFYVDYGTTNIEDTTFVFSESKYLIGSNTRMILNNATLDNVTMSNMSGVQHSEYIKINGNVSINNSYINLNGDEYNIIDITGTLNTENTSITSNRIALNVYANGTLNLDNGTEILTSGNPAVAIYGNATANIKNNVTINSTETSGISLSGNAILTVGEIGGTPSVDNPYIEGATYGIERITQTSKLYFYDGLIVGRSGPNAISGGITNVEGGYETNNIIEIDPDTNQNIYKETLTLSPTSTMIAKVGNYAFTTSGSITSSDALQNAIDFAIGDGTNVRTVDLVANVNLTLDQRSLTATRAVTINLGEYTITQDAIYSVGSNITLNQNNLGASISDVFDLSNVHKDILIYELSDGSSLDTTKNYKLYKDGKLISLEKEELGRYKYKGSNDTLIPIKGRLYIDNLTKGSYKLESSDNKYIEFSIDKDGNISGNVVESIKNSSSTMTYTDTTAELILTIQTGIKKHYYILFIIPIMLLTIILILVNKNKKREI